MQKRKLGRTDLTIAPLVFGGNVFGWTADKKTAFELLDRFVGGGAQRGRYGRRLCRLGAGQQGRRVRDDSRRMDEGAGQAFGDDRRHQGRLANGPGQEGPEGQIHRGGGGGVAAPAAGRDHRPLSLALARRRGASRGDARRLRQVDRGGQDPLVRSLQLQRRADARRARRREGERPAALRGVAARVQSLRSRSPTTARCAISACARRSASSPISASPKGS